MIRRIYHDGTYDEGTGDELHARQAGRAPALELFDFPGGRELPSEWAEAKRRQNETPEDRATRLQSATLEDLAAEVVKRPRDPDLVAALAAKATAERDRPVDSRAVRTLSGALVAEEHAVMPNHPTLPPPPSERPHERPERRGWPAYRRLWWPLKVLVWAIPGVGLLAVGYAVVVGDGAELPTYRGSAIGEVHVCPSAPGVDPLDLWSSAAEPWTRLGYRLTVRRDACDGPPAGGVAQVRAGGEVPSGFAAPSDAGHPNGVFSSPDGWPAVRGVVYDLKLDACGREHELGHALGWDDAHRMPTSRMHPACGMSWTGLEVPR